MYVMLTDCGRQRLMMKELVIIAIAVCVAAGEAPYAPRGWRPDGPSFELPQRNPQRPIKQYLPAAHPRQPTTDGSVDELAVQGLPALEQVPQFQVSPVSGLQYAGPSFNSDLRSLDNSFRQSQFQAQQQRNQEIARQRPQFFTQTPQIPNEFARTTTPLPSTPVTEGNTKSTTISLNEGEEFDQAKDKKVTTTETTKENIQEYPPELLLAPLSQIALNDYNQRSGKLILNQNENPFGGPFHLAAFQSILAQQNQRQNIAQPNAALIFVPENKAAQILPPQYRIEPVLLRNEIQSSENKTNEEQDEEDLKPEQKSEQIPQNFQPQYLQPQQPLIPNEQVYPNQPDVYQTPVYQTQQENVYQQQYPQQQYPQQQYPQQQYLQPMYQQPQNLQQEAYFVPQNQYNLQPMNNNLQIQYQPSSPIYEQPQGQYYQQQQNQQPIYQQPQAQYYQQQQQYQQPIYEQPQGQYYQQQSNLQPINQPQMVYQQYYQPHELQRVVAQNQETINVGDNKNKSEETANDGDYHIDNQEGSSFGTRTRPRVAPQYGVPTRVADDADDNTQASKEVTTTEGPISEPTTAANSRKKSAKLRSRRIRPLFTLDNSGHLVLAQEQ